MLLTAAVLQVLTVCTGHYKKVKFNISTAENARQRRDENKHYTMQPFDTAFAEPQEDQIFEWGPGCGPRSPIRTVHDSEVKAERPVQRSRAKISVAADLVDHSGCHGSRLFLSLGRRSYERQILNHFLCVLGFSRTGLTTIHITALCLPNHFHFQFQFHSLS